MIKHRHPAYQDQTQPTQATGKRIPNFDPHEEEEPESEPDYEAIIERRQERHRPDWA